MINTSREISNYKSTGRDPATQDLPGYRRETQTSSKLIYRAFGVCRLQVVQSAEFKLLNINCVGIARKQSASRFSGRDCDLQSSARFDLELFMNTSNHKNICEWVEGFSTTSQ